MKSKLSFLGGLALLFLFGVKVQAWNTVEAPFDNVAPRMWISISSFTWTELQVSTHTRLNGQTGIIVNNPPSNTSGVNCTAATSTPVIGRGTGEYGINAGANTIIPTSISIWCMTLSTSTAESISARKIGQ